MASDLAGLAAVLRAALPAGWGLRDEDAGDADLGFLSRLYASTRQDELAAVSWSDVEKQRFLADQFRLQREHYRLHYAEAGFWVIEQEGIPCGRLYVYDSPSEFRLMDIALFPEQRGQGVGSSIIRVLTRVATDQGKDVSLHVEPGNPANRLYERLGFDFVEDRGAYRFLRWTPAAKTH